MSETTSERKDMSITFNRWLRAQAHRQDRVGDLARDFNADTPRESGIRVASSADLERVLDWHGACEGAYAALQRAEVEWITSKDRESKR